MFKMPEQFDMPEVVEIPEEALWTPPVESLRKHRKQPSESDDEYVDTAALPYDDPWYCDPEVEGSDKCPQPCDPEKYWCEVPCKCPLDEDGDRPKYCDICPNPDRENDTLPRYLRLCF